jgi:GT2 family glycosyltransferase
MPPHLRADPELSVITVTHNHGRFMGPLLDSLEAERGRIDFELLVVDNASDDDSAALAAQRPWVHLIRNRARHGFAFNNNLGIRVCRGRHVLLLNPDTEVRPGALQALVDHLDAHPRVGLCGPQLLFADGSVQPSARRFPTLGWVLARRTPLRLVLEDTRWSRHHLMEDADPASARHVDWLLGAAIAVRRELLRDVGLLDDGYFLYVEDIDWAYRARKGGWEVDYVPSARVVHHYQAAIDHALWSRRSWTHARGMWRFFRKHMAPRFLRLHVRHERLTGGLP